MKIPTEVIVSLSVAITMCIAPVAAVGAVSDTAAETPEVAGEAVDESSADTTAPVEVDYTVVRQAPPWVVIRITDNVNNRDYALGVRMDEEGYTIVESGDNRIYTDPNDKYFEEEVGTRNDLQDATLDADGSADSESADAEIEGETEDLSQVPYLGASVNEDEVSAYPKIGFFGGEIACDTDSLQCNRVSWDVERSSGTSSPYWADYEARTYFGFLPGGEAFADGYAGSALRAGGFILEADQTTGHTNVGEYGITKLHVYYLPEYGYDSVHIYLDTTETGETHITCNPETGECSQE